MPEASVGTGTGRDPDTGRGQRQRQLTDIGVPIAQDHEPRASAAKRSRVICVIGNANIDLVTGHIPDWPTWGTEVFLSSSDLRIGGSAANTAIVLRRLGHSAGLISARGDDHAGDMIARGFVDPLDRIAARPERTGISVGVLQTGGERTFLSTNGHLDGLDVAFFRDSLEGWPLDGALAIVSGSFAMPASMEGQAGFLRWLKARGAEIAIDPGWPAGSWSTDEVQLARDWIAVADHVLLNELELLGLTGAAAMEPALERLAKDLPPGARLVVKRGARGAAIFRDGLLQNVPADVLDVIDTVGAGDAFNAGYLSALADGESDLVALARGVRVAGTVIMEFPRGSDPIPSAP